MNLFCISVFAVLAVFTTPVFSQVGQVANDKFQALFKARAPIKEIVAEIMTIDPFTNFKHFQTIQDHIMKNDDYAEYAKSLLVAGQKIFDHILSEIGHKEKVDIVKFINIAHNMATGKPVRDMKMIDLGSKLNSYIQKLFEDALEEAKKNIMAKFLGTLDDNTKEAAPTKKEEVETSVPIEETPVSPKKRSQPKRSKSSVTEAKKGSGAQEVRKLRRSSSSKRLSAGNSDE